MTLVICMSPLHCLSSRILGTRITDKPVLVTGFPRLLKNSGIFIGKFLGPGKSCKMTLVLKNPGNLLACSWKVLEFARQ